jgi:phage shock protein E
MTIIDVRTKDEYERFGNKDHVNIPLDELEKNLDKIKEIKDPVILCCRSGSRSEVALNILKKDGIKTATNGGICNEI